MRTHLGAMIAHVTGAWARWLTTGWRWALGASLGLGVTLSALGLWGDAQDWWVERPFLLNALSSTASGLIGVPVTALVVGTVVDTAREQRARAALKTQTVTAIAELVALSQRMLGFDVRGAGAAVRTASRLADAGRVEHWLEHRERDDPTDKQSAADAADRIRTHAHSRQESVRFTKEVAQLWGRLVQLRDDADARGVSPLTAEAWDRTAEAVRHLSQDRPASWSYSGDVDWTLDAAVLHVAAVALHDDAHHAHRWPDGP